MEKRYVITPHPDIELGIKRNELEYFLTFPNSGINSDTGLIFCIGGFGEKADSEYQSTKLRPYLADNYNCITVGINYFGIGSRLETGATIAVSDDFLYWFREIYGTVLGPDSQNSPVNAKTLLKVRNRTGIFELDARCTLLLTIAKGEYQSFGFLPAIDHLQVLSEILNQFNINRKRIIAFGTSYGGYIALLLGKFAPNTFSAIIDNSGFVNADLRYIVGNEILRTEVTALIGGMRAKTATNSIWTILDETSPYFFSGSCRDVRNLLHQKQIAESDTKYYIFHSAEDDIVLIQWKETFVDMLKAKNVRIHFRKITSADIDGRVFKNTAHGMDASMRGVFDLVAGLDKDNLCKQHSSTDFDLKSTHSYICGNKSYIFKYNGMLNVSVETV